MSALYSINLRSQVVFTCRGAHVRCTTLRRHVTSYRRADDIIAVERPMTALRCAVKTLSPFSNSLRRESEIKTWHTPLAWGGGEGWQSSVFRCHWVSLLLVTLNGSSGSDRSDTSFKLIAPRSYPSRFLAPSMRRRADHVREM